LAPVILKTKKIIKEMSEDKPKRVSKGKLKKEPKKYVRVTRYSKRNVPYIRMVDSEGNVVPPTEAQMKPIFPNRRMRNAERKKQRFYGESKNYHLTVTHNIAYIRFKQIIIDKKTGKKKVIEHYIPKKAQD
jgi:hypothetical protein